MQRNFLEFIDAKDKLILILIGAIASVAFSDLYAQLTLFAATFCLALTLRKPALLLVLYGFMAFMMAIAVFCTLLLSQFIAALADFAVPKLVVPFLRGLTMMNLVVGLAMTTKIEQIMQALSALRLPFLLTLPSTVMIRFIPTFANDVIQVWETLKIRGWQMNFKMLCCHPLLSARLVFTPILFRALKSSESLGVAAELKGLDRGFRSSRQAYAASKDFHEKRAQRLIWVLTALVLITSVSLEVLMPADEMTQLASRVP